MRQTFRCEYCGFTGSAFEVEQHEVRCREEKKKREEDHKEYLRKIEERLEKAREYASQAPVILLLCSNGFIDEARQLCRKWAGRNLWDCGTSSGMEAVYNAMIDAALEACGGISEVLVIPRSSQTKEALDRLSRHYGIVPPNKWSDEKSAELLQKIYSEKYK